MGEDYFDMEGLVLEEKFWLCFWMNNMYFWYDEVDDNLFENFIVEVYFV